MRICRREWSRFSAAGEKVACLFLLETLKTKRQRGKNFTFFRQSGRQHSLSFFPLSLSLSSLAASRNHVRHPRRAGPRLAHGRAGAPPRPPGLEAAAPPRARRHERRPALRRRRRHRLREAADHRPDVEREVRFVIWFAAQMESRDSRLCADVGELSIGGEEGGQREKGRCCENY